MKVYVLTMAYCNANVFRAGMKALNETVDMRNVQHLILDQHYALGRPALLDAITEYVSDIGGDDFALRNVSGRLNKAGTGSRLVVNVGRNLGCHEGLNALVDYLPFGPMPEDIVVAFDPDEQPLKPGWLDAMIRVMEADQRVAWLSLMNPPCRNHLDSLGCKPEMIGGERVQFPGHALMNCVVAWRFGAIQKVGRFTEPHAYYGGIEGAMQPRFMDAGYRIGWMTDYDVQPLHELADPEYAIYKRHHVGFAQPEFPGSFDEWLAMKAK